MADAGLGVPDPAGGRLLDGALTTVSAADLQGKYNEDVYNAKDGELVKRADHLAAFVEAYAGIRNGSTSQDLQYARVKIGTQEQQAQYAGLNFGRSTPTSTKGSLSYPVRMDNDGVSRSSGRDPA